MALPKEMMIQIFSYIDDTKTLWSLSVASQTFNRLAEPFLYQRFDDQSRKGSVRRFLLTIIKRPDLSHYVKELDIDFSITTNKSEGSRQEFRFLRSCAQGLGLTNKIFIRCLRSGLVSADILLLLNLLPNVVELRYKDAIARHRIHAGIIGDTIYPTGQFNITGSLCVARALNVRSENEEDPAPTLLCPITDWLWAPRLESMEIHLARLFKKDWGPALETITCLALDNCQLIFREDELRAFFSVIASLRSFRISYINNVTSNVRLRPADIIAALVHSHAASLEELKFICCFGWEDESLTRNELSGEIIGGIFDLSQLFRLRMLEIDQFSVDFTTALANSSDFRLCKVLPDSIEVLRIQCCNQLLLRHLKDLATMDYVMFPHLRYVWIAECDYMGIGNDHELEYLAALFHKNGIFFSWQRSLELTPGMWPISGAMVVPGRMIGRLERTKYFERV